MFPITLSDDVQVMAELHHWLAWGVGSVLIAFGFLGVVVVIDYFRQLKKEGAFYKPENQKKAIRWCLVIMSLGVLSEVFGMYVAGPLSAGIIVCMLVAFGGALIRALIATVKMFLEGIRIAFS